VLFLVAALGLSACSVRRVNRRLILPEERPTLDQESPYLKVHLKNGGLLVLDEWEIKEEEGLVSGVGALYDARRDGGESAYRSASLDSVALFETNVTTVSPSVGALVLFSGISLAGTAYCIANPKSCFGSCPTFYVNDGEREVLMAEGFSASIAPSLEASDVDALAGAPAAAGRLEVAMVNEALETHVVRHVDLLAVPRPRGERVFATPDAAEFWRAGTLAAPASARGPEGGILSAVLALDGVERYTAADSTDLAARETLEFTFAAPGGGPWGLVIGNRQTLLSTYLFYQTLASMGTQAGSWLALLQRPGAKGKARLSGMGEILGGIAVWVERDGTWVRAGEIQEHGPLATDVVLVPLPDGREETLRVQLRMARGKHRLDYVALATLTGTVEPVRLSPTLVYRGGDAGTPGTQDAKALSRLTDPGQTLVTLPGDRYTLVYDLPALDTTGVPGVPLSWDLFLESRGYYLEWIREAWIREESPAEVAEVLLFPRRALRRLAPEFKAMEGEMEGIFWGSKYARP
jgi:hypothetical protein